MDTSTAISSANEERYIMLQSFLHVGITERLRKVAVSAPGNSHNTVDQTVWCLGFN